MKNQGFLHCIITLSILYLITGCQGVNTSEDISALNISENGAKFMFSGTYTKKEGHVDGKANGLDVFILLPEDSLKHVFTEGKVINPSYLAISADGQYVYVVNETGPDVGSAGKVSAFRFNPEKSTLQFLNSRSSHGFNPCYINVDSGNRMAFAVNYSSGVIAVYPLDENGKLEKNTQLIQLEGKGIHTRQEASHPHSITLSPDEQFAYIADLGTDKVMIYRIDYENHQLVDGKFISLSPASGPRHTVFHPNGKYFFVINELSSTIAVFEHYPENGDLRHLQTFRTIPETFSGENTCADIHMSVDGRYLYGSNRGHNSIVIFAVDPETGALDLIGHESTRGEVPRNFAINGNKLYVANQNTDNIVAFKIQEDGTLSFITEYEALTPVCIKFLEVPPDSGDQEPVM